MVIYLSGSYSSLPVVNMVEFVSLVKLTPVATGNTISYSIII